MRRPGGMAVTPERRRRRRGNVSGIIVVVAVAVFLEAWRDHGWQSAAWFIGTFGGLLALLWLIEVYVEWPMHNTQVEPPPIKDWATTDTPPGARVYRGHPHFQYETHAEAAERRAAGVADTKLKPRQPRAVRMQRGSRMPFKSFRRPYETELEAAMGVILERRRGELETCESPERLIMETLVEAMGGDEPSQEVRDWFVHSVLARVDSDRHMARLPTLDQARANWRGRGA